LTLVSRNAEKFAAFNALCAVILRECFGRDIEIFQTLHRFDVFTVFVEVIGVPKRIYPNKSSVYKNSVPFVARRDIHVLLKGVVVLYHRPLNDVTFYALRLTQRGVKICVATADRAVLFQRFAKRQRFCGDGAVICVAVVIDV